MVATLESIVEKFGEEMAPYAVGLMQHLAIAFWRIVDADDKVNCAALILTVTLTPTQPLP